MATLSNDRIRALLLPYLPDPAPGLVEKLSVYLDLLMKWNDKTNLSAIRDPEEIVCRHFGESLFTALHLPPCKTLLDLGSGAGFPGLPIALARPEIGVTLAESQNKKAVFLREVVRTLGVDVEVWGERAEKLPADRLFDVVTLRAVDNPSKAIAVAKTLLTPDGHLVELLTDDSVDSVASIRIPGSSARAIRISKV